MWSASFLGISGKPCPLTNCAAGDGIELEDALYTSERSLRRWVRLAVWVDSVVLREPEERESSLRDEGRLEGAGISPRRPVEREGGGWAWLAQIIVSSKIVRESCDALLTVCLMSVVHTASWYAGLGT